MRAALALTAAVALLAGSGWALAQSSTSDARAEGEELADSLRDATSDSILASGSEAAVPGFGGTTFAESDLIDDPDGLSAAGEAQRSTGDYQTVVDPHRTRFDPLTIDLSAPDAVADDPDAYLGTGLGLGGNTGQCERLPGGPGAPLTYLESCNDTPEIPPTQHTCSAAAELTAPPSVTVICEDLRDFGTGTGEYDTCPAALAPSSGGTCALVDATSDTSVEDCESGGGYCAYSVTSYTYACTSGPPSVSFNWSSCSPPTGSCSMEEVCSDSSPTTRTINGVEVDLPCWEYERRYTCGGRSPRNDCSALDAKPECRFSHDECLSYEADNTTCNIYDRWYSCSAPGGTAASSDFICDGDLYCIDGECTAVTRQASTEFNDAMVAVQTLGELRDDFDPDNLTLFAGENLDCSKKLFGLSNCCSGKGIPLVTPFLCSAEDRLVDQKDDDGLCHKVGTYCSSKVLGICTAKKQSYCCFSSKLTRILQEEGRAQLGKPWGKPKDPDCAGFEVSEFQQLNLAAMDFSEVYEEFAEAARLPDEIEASLMIQQRIADYYHLHAGNP